MSKYWIKLYHEILDDPKMGLLTDHLFRRAIELFLLAGEKDDDGTLPNIEHIAWRLHTSIDALQIDLEILQCHKIVTQAEDGNWIVTKFAERQRPATDAERVERYREHQRKEELIVTNRNRNVTTLLQKAVQDTDTDTDIDKDSSSPNGDKPALEKPKRKAPTNPHKADIQELQKYFLIKTHLPAPKVSDPKACQKLWWSPLQEIGGLYEWDIGKARALIDATLLRMSGLTVSDPNSIIKTARAVYAEQNGGGQSTASIASEVW